MVFSRRDPDEQEISGKEESRTLLTIVGNKARIEGKLDVSQSIEIGCEVVGEVIVNGQMVIQKEGVVSADVTTIDARIIGRFEGNMKGTGKVEITETGVVDGNIKTDSLIINEGGIFSGKVTRITEGEEKGKKKFKPKEMEEEKVSAKAEKKEKAGEIKEFELGDIDDSLRL
ncbi:MAG: polymer-forming cytoskeletal protein [Actinobacteria bacterium]|nr:polymer-forming cytoskeletal protein [Actinomycetota bacterium]